MSTDAPDSTDRVERAFLGSLLLVGRDVLWGKVSRTLRSEHLLRESHRVIYDAICAVGKTADPDLVLVIARLDDDGHLERAGGAAYVASLVDDLPDVENVVEYAKVIRSRAALRIAAKVRR